jgi:hypothetical protein
MHRPMPADELVEALRANRAAQAAALPGPA